MTSSGYVNDVINVSNVPMIKTHFVFNPDKAENLFKFELFSKFISTQTEKKSTNILYLYFLYLTVFAQIKKIINIKSSVRFKRPSLN